MDAKAREQQQPVDSLMRDVAPRKNAAYRAGLAAAGVAAGITALLLGALILRGQAPYRAAFDAMLYHQEAVRSFAAQWPDANVYDYLSATTPGYHLLLAAAAQLFGTSYTTLAAFGSLWTLLLLGVLAFACARRGCGVLVGVALALVLLASTYVLWAGAAVLPDNAGWALVLVQMLLAMRMTRGGACASGIAALSQHRRATAHFGFYAMLFGAAFLACVLVRQAHAWTAGLLIAAAWLAPGTHDARAGHVRAFFALSKDRIVRLAIALWMLVPGIAALALFVRLWGGLVPPRFADQYPPKEIFDKLLSPAPVFVLAVFGMLSPFVIGLAWRGLANWWREQRGLLLAVCASSFMLMLLPITTYDFDAGRRTGLWNLAEKLPTVGHVSPPMVALALAGLLVLLGLLRQVPRAERWILALSLLGFAAALSASNELWQRYVEPLALLVVVLCAACIAGTARTSARTAAHVPPRRLSRLQQVIGSWALVGPLALACVLLAVSVMGLLRNPLDMRGEKPPTRSPIHRGIVPPVELPPLPRDGRTLWMN